MSPLRRRSQGGSLDALVEAVQEQAKVGRVLLRVVVDVLRESRGSGITGDLTDEDLEELAEELED